MTHAGPSRLAALLFVGLLLRSYWSVAVVGLSLGALMLWLKGLSNLVGLKQDQILTTIVPIAMVSFGVDFAFRAMEFLLFIIKQAIKGTRKRTHARLPVPFRVVKYSRMYCAESFTTAECLAGI